MAHRIEVELTSRGDDSHWTWRAAGARQPRGTVDAGLVPDGAAVGSVYRAEVEVGLDGTVVTALLPPKPRGDLRDIERIEVVGTPQRGPDVNVVLASKGRRPRSDRDGERGGRGRDRRDTRRDDRRPRVESGDQGRGSHPEGSARGGARPGGRDARGNGGRPGGRDGRRPGGRDTRQRRPAESTTYRNAALATLKPEQLPVAEQLIKGGIPAVRQALEEQNARARAEGRPEVTPEPLLALAEQLRPVVALATWKDRASAAQAAGKDTPLRELRSIVAASSTVGLDEEATEMATALRASLDQRVTALREGWLSRITAALDEGRAFDAVRISNRSPEPSARLTAELAVRVSEAAGAAMSPDTSPEQWLAMLGVVLDSPVRRTVKPAGLPAGADEALLVEARKAAGAVPELARLLGIPIPPPPGPRRPPARSGSGRRPA